MSRKNKSKSKGVGSAISGWLKGEVGNPANPLKLYSKPQCPKCGHDSHKGLSICQYEACVCQFGSGMVADVEPGPKAPAYTGRSISALMTPEMRAMFTGVSLGELPSGVQPKSTQFYLYDDGLWCQYTLPMGVLTTKNAEWKNDRLPARPKGVVAGFQLSVPKLHADLLLQIVTFFKAVNEKYKSEAYVSVFWNGSTYHVEVPEQIITGAHVDHIQTRDFPGEIEVLQIHSHDTMGAFFSGTDDSDERKHGQRLYAVFGKLNQVVPESKWRVLAGDTFFDIKLGDVVEWPEFVVEQHLNGALLFPQGGSSNGITQQPVAWDPCSGVVFPDSWMEQVRVQSATVEIYHGGYCGGYLGGGVDTSLANSFKGWQGHSNWHDQAREHLKESTADPKKDLIVDGALLRHPDYDENMD